MATSAHGNGSSQQGGWDAMLDVLSSMISGKRKADGSSWRDAHENMPVYLQVSAAEKLAAARGNRG